MPNMEEYIIKLGTQMDSNGLNQIMDFLNTFRKSTLGVTAAIGAATTALYKFIESTTKQEMEIKKLAKAQGISIEQMTKQKSVLDAMGKSLQEVRKDDKLKKTYEEIMKFNKELELPSASGSIKRIEELRNAFWKLRSIVNLAVSSIGKQLLVNLEAPIKRITGGMNKISDWVRSNLNSISHKVSSVLTAFAKGIIGIGEVFGKIFKWITSLPAGIKAIATAIGVLSIALTAGPIGRLLMLITMVGNLIHDYENFQWNKNNAENTEFWAADNEQGWTRDKSKATLDENGNAIAYKVPLLLEPAWEGYDQNGISGVAQAFVDKITEGIGSIDASGAGEEFGKFIVTIFDQLTATVDGAGQATGGILGAGIALGKKIFTFLGTAIKQIAPVGGEIGDFVSSIFTQVGEFLSAGAGGANAVLGDATSTLGTVASGILDFIIQGLNSLLKEDKDGRTGIEKFVKGIFDFIGSAITDFATRMELPEGSKGKIDASGTIANIGTQIGDIIGSAIQLGVHFLDNFLKDAKDWVLNNKDELIKIGLAIMQGIVDGLLNIKDAIMRRLFGDWWVGNVERRDTAANVKKQFIDPETGEVNEVVVGKSGKEYRLDESQEFSRTDARAAQVEFGLREATAFEEYKRVFYDLLGDSEMSRRLGYGDENVTLASSIARMFGARYDPTTMTFSGKNGQFSGDQNANLMSLLGELSFTDSVESFKQVFGDIQEIMNENGLEASVDISNAEQAAEAARQKMEETFAANPVNVPLEVGGSGDGDNTAGEAFGGRFDRAQKVTVGEDGAEYIIPISKPERAAALLKQMVSEMGSSAHAILGSLGIGTPGTNGASTSSIASAMSGMQMHNSNNINAPITIYVNSSGASAEEIGNNVYNVAERNLIKNIAGVLA